MSSMSDRTTRPPTRARRRLRDIRTVRVARRLTQVGFAVLILVSAVRHQAGEQSGNPSVDALCPFGAAETLITWLSTGSFITKTHPSNLVLGLAVLIATLLVGNAFCGWVCPFGALQDAVTWVRRVLRVPTVSVPPSLDRALRWGRFVVLGLVLYMSVTTARLWFFDYDPYVMLFSLRWWFELSSALLPGLVILGVVILASVVVDRAWCRYACPLGAVFAVLSRFSLLRIRRAPAVCTDCSLCDTPCPVGIEPSLARPFVSTDCIGCMDCLTACPVKGALRMDGPVLLGFPVRPDADGPRPRGSVVAAKAGDR